MVQSTAVIAFSVSSGTKQARPTGSGKRDTKQSPDCNSVHRKRSKVASEMYRAFSLRPLNTPFPTFPVWTNRTPQGL
jgi:hypothetical protein